MDRVTPTATVERVDGEEEAYRQELRTAVARALHDGPVRELTGAIGRLEGFRALSANPAMQAAISAIEEHARASLASMRRIIADLREEPPEESLPTMVADLTDRYERSFGIEFDLVVAPTWPRVLPADQSLHLLRILQEAISNAIRHARPRHVLVEMVGDSRSLLAAVHDDGSGIPPRAVRRPGTGIRGMRERAALLGGRLTISPRSHGTRVQIVMPRPRGG
jgi:signal transduction histidine kinase